VWGPSPVPRAGGRCLDVVRLLRITAGSPAVEATSLRCQAVLEAFRGRTEAARRLLASARESLEELGLVHGLLEAELFSGIVELLAGELATAQASLERALDGLRALGADADAARAGALLGRVHLERGDLDGAEQRAREAERLAGDDLQAGIAWRRVEAEVLARRGRHDDAGALAEAAVEIASRTDALVQHADACVGLAAVRRAAGDHERASAATRQAAELYDRKGATALAAAARAAAEPAHVLSPSPPALTPSEPPANGAVRAYRRFESVFAQRGFASVSEVVRDDFMFVDERTVTRGRFDRAASDTSMRVMAEQGGAAFSSRVVATRGDHLALLVSQLPYEDHGTDAFANEAAVVLETAEDGRLCSVAAYAPDDLDGAIADLDRRYIAGEGAPHEGVLTLVFESIRAYNARDWEELRACNDPDVVVVDRMRGGWYEQHGVDTAIASYQRQLLGTDARSLIRAVRPISADAVLLSIATSGHSAHGGDVEVH